MLHGEGETPILKADSFCLGAKRQNAFQVKSASESWEMAKCFYPVYICQWTFTPPQIIICDKKGEESLEYFMESNYIL